MASELSEILKQLEVPCTIREDNQKGKAMVATKGVKGNTVLFEEIPIVSWSFSTRPSGTYCDWCLATLDHQQQHQQRIRCPEHKSNGCIGVYCSEDCVARSRASHQFMCGPELAAIRNFDLKELMKQNEQDEDDLKTAGDNELPQDGLPITLESLARSIASVGARYIAYATYNPEATSQQLFPLAAQMFNRLVSAPEGSEFDEIDSASWFGKLRELMADKMVKIFDTTLCSGEDAKADKACAKRNKEIVAALTSEDTLNVMLGQLTLNSQALNLPIPVPKREREEDNNGNGNNNDDDDDETENSSSVGGVDDDKIKKLGTNEPKIIRPSVGAGVFALHSTLNHSCDPNAFVTFTDNHEIAVKLKKAVRPGEEITITYIPELFLKLERYEARRERLKNYFFKCSCARCLKEENQAKEAQKKSDLMKKTTKLVVPTTAVVSNEDAAEEDDSSTKRGRSSSEETL